MVFKSHCFNLKGPHIYIYIYERKQTCICQRSKYLGVILCNDLKNDGDILRHLRNFMLGLIALSENFTTVPWVLNYVCFMHIAVQLIVANYGLTLIRALI